MEPLDLIFFKGTDIISRSVCLGEDISSGSSEFSHVGIVINNDLLKLDCLNDKTFYVLESTVSYDYNTIDVVSGKPRIGVQIREFENLKKHYLVDDCKMAWAKLKNNPFVFDRENCIKKFEKTYIDYGRRFYDMNPLTLLAAVFPCLRRPRDFFDTMIIKGEKVLNKNLGLNNVFCSELVTLVYQQQGLISNSIDPEDILPVDILGDQKDGFPAGLFESINYIS